METPSEVFAIKSIWDAIPLVVAFLLLVILVVSFRSRATVFCQYLQAMTGIRLKPHEVGQVFKDKGRDGVRELFLDLIIREDLKHGPLRPDTPPKPQKAPTATAKPKSA